MRNACTLSKLWHLHLQNDNVWCTYWFILVRVRTGVGKYLFQNFQDSLMHIYTGCSVSGSFFILNFTKSSVSNFKDSSFAIKIFRALYLKKNSPFMPHIFLQPCISVLIFKYALFRVLYILATGFLIRMSVKP